MPELKYQDEMDKLPCDLDNFNEEEREAFRWVFEDIDDSRNFLPRYLLKENMERKNCIGWALSMFDTQSQAVDRIKEIARGRNLIYKKLGTHVSKGILKKDDGISDDPNKKGHFSFFEYKKTDLSTQCSIVKSLK